MLSRKKVGKERPATEDRKNRGALNEMVETQGEDATTPDNRAQDSSGSAHANGMAPELDAEQLRTMAVASKAMSAALGEIVALLMRSPHYKHYPLADLEWLVLPALLAGQFSLVTAQSKTNGLAAPVGLTLWATVSDEVDRRLSAEPREPVRLKPHEWKSGDNLWVVLAVGDKRILHRMLGELHATPWMNRPVKLLVTGSDGVVRVAAMQSKAAANAP